MSEYRLAEKPVVDALEAMGWQVLPSTKASTMREEGNRVILKPVLVEALCALNGIGAEDAEAIYNDLATLSDNEEWQRKLRGGYSRRLSGQNRDSPVVLIDFKQPDRNRFHVTSQFRVAAQRPRIPDIVLCVNGIPLVVIEAKSPLKATAKAEEAFEQVKQYERDIPRLFYSNVFNLITDGMTTLYGATGALSQFYAPWPDAWPRQRDQFADDLAKDLWCLCEPSRLLDLLAHFIVFETDPETGRKVKKICRYQQFRAVNKAVERVAEGRRRKGLIWHTQGSGKSLTMVFLALKLKTHLTLDAPSLANPNILVLTDRIDLDDQISKTFVACGLPNPTQCGSVAALREAVNRGGNGQILLSTIFKFAGSKEPIPNSANWIVLVDECHRTQEKNLGAFLQATLPDAHFYGFTGTPIKSTDKDTYARFSIAGEGYLDKYGIDDAVRDGATVPILYEGRKADWAIDEAEIDILFDRWFLDLPDDKREELKRKGLTLATIAKHPERIRLIAKDVWEHFKAVCQPDGFKAQVVVVDREAVILYRAALSAVIAADLQRGGMSAQDASAKADAKIACVYSKSQEDNKPSERPEVTELRAGLEAHYLDDTAEKEVKKRFKTVGQEPSFLIVCDKLLTGFDAPIEHVMYLDKPLKEHNLLQAIARTNRTYTIKLPSGGEIEKPNGRIVDYIGVTNHLDEALRSYRHEDVENAMRDIAILRNDLKEAHGRYRMQKRAMGLEDMGEKAAAYAAAKLVAGGREDDWFDLQRFTRTFIKVYGDLAPDPAILEFTAEVKWASAFLRLATQAISKDESLDHRSYSGKIREMLEQHVHVTGLSTTIRLRDITDPNFADDFATEGRAEPELQEAFVRKSAELRRVTRELVDKNPVQYGRFSERVLEILRRFEEGQLAAADGLREFEGLTGDIEAERGAHAELGMDQNAFSILRIIEATVPDSDHAALQGAAIAIGAVYAEAAATQPAFAHMEAYLRSLRQQVRRILTEHGIGETKVIREKVEEFAIHAYGGAA
ncbi:MAG: type I restriction endonuclease subunit R [Mesorhizobium sp.]|uniref:type I restriction endonuclease subunit R n=1 Tax=Mesorhizobium sp. TaxID=1871066 RepID=UPI000FE902F1|nr:type I restriction endonuclease subunit R [Mesorhizobium sp.]RWL79402.1 MAG: type I restriction endonuclease subunit R [Mesorhizobium sp.]RWL83178.1 MAG: type I restriction endonuclease subunit R [Mesorhizobium sp.]RWL93968.1 MAG: type I restriction endonuclease subunit R [Mesorhizobium sp.]